MQRQYSFIYTIRENISMDLYNSIPFGSFRWFIFASLACLFIVLACMMSFLLMALMSIGPLQLKILQLMGTPNEKKQAAVVLPVFQRQHQIYVSLLFCNAALLAVLPLYLDKLVNGYTSIIVSVLACGLVIPQVICCSFGLLLGAQFHWLIRVVMILCYPIAYPIGKILDWGLGCNEGIFRRAQFKAPVSIHNVEAGEGGELTNDETKVIVGAIDLTVKTAQEAMTPIESTFTLDINSNLDWDAKRMIQKKGHTRVPVYSENPKKIVGLLLVRSLLTIQEEIPISALNIRRIPRIPADLPLYNILNMYRKGSTFMAAVVKGKSKGHTLVVEEKVKASKALTDASNLTAPLLYNFIVNVDGMRQSHLHTDEHLSWEIDDREVIGIITIKDVLAQLLQDKSMDETDEYVDMEEEQTDTVHQTYYRRGGPRQPTEKEEVDFGQSC
ncbi:PREDICTED: DUF21 domain-containing protein At4g14240-like isoform X2 [Camelina sativa]|uniref:DUF21 domain-containing protein At4g14240-like isoform X2 n=1 Tax=Camelina sativa TaxID=90675 RepID=A0ABM1R1F3_CAMSA|nr:PREDICTED: DUF21 domain-containing protein At4g14240-like isoform X2 [Camelina sativa]